MKIYLKYDMMNVCRNILQEQLEKLGFTYTLEGIGELELMEPNDNDAIKQLVESLNKYGIEVVETQKSIIVQKIKDVISEMVFMEDELPAVKISTYLAEKLDMRYTYLASLFSTVTYTSIENFIILQKIERAKQLIITEDLNFTEIAWKLNYSSVAHFSTQFKNATGLTPTAFQRIIQKRREKQNMES